MKRAIQCKYSCFQCGILKQIVTVKMREDEDVITWMNTVCAPALSRDHDRRSPRCKITSLSEVWIPVPDGTTKVGGVPPDKPEVKQ